MDDVTIIVQPNTTTLTVAPSEVTLSFNPVGSQGIPGGARYNSESIALSQNENNWALTIASTLHIINVTGNYNITGVTGAVAGDVMILYNSGTGTATIVSDSPLSLAANRFNLAGNLLLGTGAMLFFIYNGTNWSLPQ